MLNLFLIALLPIIFIIFYIGERESKKYTIKNIPEDHISEFNFFIENHLCEFNGDFMIYKESLSVGYYTCFYKKIPMFRIYYRSPFFGEDKFKNIKRCLRNGNDVLNSNNYLPFFINVIKIKNKEYNRLMVNEAVNLSNTVLEYESMTKGH